MAGRGRGQKRLDELRRSIMTEPLNPSNSPSPEASAAPSTAPSVAPSVASTSTSAGSGGRGRGRGRASLQILQQQRPGGTSTSAGSGGRGRALLQRLQQQRPGGSAAPSPAAPTGSPLYSPACDVAASLPAAPPRGLGRGASILPQQHAKQVAAPAQRDVSALTQQMSQTSVTVASQATSVGKNKNIEPGDFKADWSRGATKNPVLSTVDIVRWTVLYTKRDEQCVMEPGDFKADWSRGATKNPVLSTVDIVRWTVLYTKRDEQCVMNFVDALMRCCDPMGIFVVKPRLMRLPSDRTEAYVTALRQLAGTQLCVCVCPTSRDDRYSAIKRICDVEIPMPSQVINSRIIMNKQKLMAITQKILLQMNCKLGGSLWPVPMPVKHAMVVGIDTYHDAKTKSRSVLAFIASIDQSLTRWFSRAVYQDSDSLRSCMVQALQHYLSTNGRLPDRVFMFRDGVGDGVGDAELRGIQKYEIPQMQICFTEFQMNYKPSLTYVLVQKRINTRIFLKARGEFDNPPPGTVVDHKITRRDWYDFLIASQEVTQGAVTPTHYVVLYDDSGMSPEQCQRLTYKLCHLYNNWPGCVRVPAPCQYAHKLAYLASQYMNQQPSGLLGDKLYFF